jgi:hypothetical protein
MFKYSVFLLALISNYALSEVKLPDIAPHYTHYKGLHDVMMHSVENDSTLTTAQKMAEYTKQLNQLKTEFRAKRKSEYGSVNVELRKGNSCTKGYSGGSKHCDKYIDAPKNYYTKSKWTSRYKENGSPMNKLAIVTNNGLKVWSKIKKSGQGRYYEQIRATFRLQPLYIEKSLNSDTTSLFNRILVV